MSLNKSVKSTFFERLWRFGRVGFLLIVAWWLLAWGAARSLIVSSDLTHADALVVLAGSSTYVERTHRAAQLFGEGVAPRIFLTNDNLPSGWSAARERNPLFVERAIDELERQGVPADKIEILPGVVSGTHEEIMRVRECADERKLTSILVVTSAYHSRRAWWTLRHVFRDSEVRTGLDAASPDTQSPHPATWWWHGNGWRMVPLEYAKLIYYWLRYR